MSEAQLALAMIERSSSDLKHPWLLECAAIYADALDALGRSEEAKALREKYGVTEPEKPAS